jgi:2-amino-4-hydroxy-6-hydroxymethyldihydropteridine diphosphokinase
VSLHAYVGLGGNVGGEEEIVARFETAIARLGSAGGARVSSLYRTAPVGEITQQPPFLNAVLALPIASGEGLHPLPLLQSLTALEQDLGRTRRADSRAGGPRTVDLDLIAYGELQWQTRELTLPHPRAAERAFVLAPLLELAGPSYCLPGESRTVLELLRVPTVAVQAIERLELKLCVPPA